MKKYRTFKEFYPFYLSQHQNDTCRRLHYVGSLLVLLLLFYSIATSHYTLLLFMPVIGYGFAWVGHFFYEKNKPATFTYPWYSFLGDWVMLYQFLFKRKTKV
ncbi:DUF962 domain-containing protein [Thalassomonas sp. M1454]|uniref:DUF962 domain-containing protein n=1 Tax=Thalassomonas sp. M1454 TaxID=2594477 RepID=UPI00117ED2E8|nr:DUF962 domain-containing protein [Thalassomonas sp. M1454]TRX57064.1 DUF962 domain-containing protein [Thalassomonas sp. M1454]